MEFWFLKVVPKFLNTFINQLHIIVANQCRDINIGVFLDFVYELERNVLLISALRQFYSKTETDSVFEKPIVKKSGRCPK
jgi:hypothetical protein